MARWKLTEPHYLNVPGTKWEQTLTDRVTGRPKRLSYPVPLYLHPDVESDWNYQENRNVEGEIIVCHEGKGLPKDIVFAGEPTPGMLPLDEEATAISGKFADKWVPNTGLDDGSQRDGFQQKLLMGLLDKFNDASNVASAVPLAPGFEKLMETMMGMMAQQTQILAMLAEKQTQAVFEKTARDLGEQPVLDNEPPLADAEPTPEEIAEASRVAAAAEAASVAKATARASSRRI